MADFSTAHKFTAKWEGGISNDKADLGGFTAYGVSTAFMKSLKKARGADADFLNSIGLAGPVTLELMRKITPAQAAKIFRFHFWDPYSLDLYKQSVATVYYDCLVNHGKSGGTKIAQRGINRHAGHELLVPDGIFGPKTFAALRKASRDTARCICLCRRDYYQAIVKNNMSQKRFLKGWLNRTADLEALLEICID